MERKIKLQPASLDATLKGAREDKLLKKGILDIKGGHIKETKNSLMITRGGIEKT